MKIVLLFIMSIWGASLQAAVAEYVPIQSNPMQTIEMQDGGQLLVYQGQNAKIAISYISESKKRGWLSITIQNISNENINVSEQSVVITSAGMPLKVYTYAELEKAQKNEEMWVAIANGITAASNSYSAGLAGTSYSSGTYNSNTTTSVYSGGGAAYGSANTRGTYSGYTYDSGAAQAAQANANAQNQQLFDRAAQNSKAAQQNLEARALKANTISPGEIVSGQIKFDLPKYKKGLLHEIQIVLSTIKDSTYFVFREVQ